VPIDERSPSQASATFYSMIGRLAPGATLAAATQQVQGAIDDRAPVNPARRNHRAVVESLSTYYRTSNARPLYFFLGASLLVLLLTIANVAGLMVSRAVRRTPEFALRSAIGGGTRSLAAQLTAEGALVAVPGCALGLALAYAATRVLGQFVPDDFLIRGEHIPIDARVAGATLMVALITTASLTLVPLGIIRRVGERAALGAGHRTSDIPMAGRSRRILLTGQLAVTMTLLAGTGVFVKSYLELMQVPLGFEPANAWSIRIAMSGSRFERPESVRAYVESVSDRLRAVPGIQHVAAATSSPLLSGWLAMVTPASPPSPQAAGARVVLRSVGADYFRAAGTPIVRGRGFAGTDRPGAPAVAVINEELARRMFPDADPIGREIEFSAVRVATMGRGLATIVGIASDIKEIGLNEVRMADLYLPFEQRPSTSVELIARGQGVDAAMIAALRTAASDAVVPVITVGSLHSRVSRALQNERFHLMVVAAFAWLAVLTAGIGLYGAMAYAVTTRRREFGVRLALGASRRSLVGGTLLQSARLALVGGVAGLAAALLLARWIGDALYLVPGSHNGLLYNTNTTDPVALGVALAAILMLALLASAIPARRASRIDPAQALRAD
jgi:putative ABC transport system permease protein